MRHTYKGPSALPHSSINGGSYYYSAIITFYSDDYSSVKIDSHSLMAAYGVPVM